MTVSSQKSLGVQVTVVEEDLNLLQTGQPVELFFDALPEADVRGKIARIVPQRMSGDQSLYPVFISLDPAPAGLVAGMSVDATITIAAKSDVLRLPRSAVRSTGADQAQVEVWTGQESEMRTIQVGLRGDSYVEVLSGLQEGDQVVVE